MVTTNGVDWGEAEGSQGIHFVTHLEVDNIYPIQGRLQGGTRVQLQGKRFDTALQIWCRFGLSPAGVIVLATTTTSTGEYACLTPVFDPVLMGVQTSNRSVYDVQLDVSANGKDFVSTLQTFQYVPAPRVMRVSPIRGSMSGSTTVTVRGDNFEAGSRASWCRFGTAEVRASVVSSTELLCVAPPSAYAESVALEVSMNDGVDYSDNQVQYEFVAPPRIRMLEPVEGPVRGGTVLKLSGLNFYASKFAKCCFGRRTYCMSAILVDSSGRQIRCKTPPAIETPPTSSVGVSVPVFLTLNGQDFHRLNHAFEYYLDPIVESVSPSSGEVTGGTEVLVTGRFFRYSVAAACLFDDKRAPAQFVNATALKCTAPPHKKGSASIAITLNGQDFSVSASPFMYTELPMVYELVPTQGPPQGGTEIRVRGLALSPTAPASVSCRFTAQEITTVVPAVVDSDSVVTCVTPKARGAGVALVSVAWNELDRHPFAQPLAFTYVEPAVLYALRPRLVDSLSLTKLSIIGNLFPSSTATACCFSKTLANSSEQKQCVNANRISETRVDCVTPELATGSFAVHIEVDHVPITEKGTELTLHVHSPVQVTRVTPTRGSYQGNTSVVVEGVNFMFTPELSCCFDGQRVAAFFVNSTRVECLSPPSGIRAATVQVSLNGRDCLNRASEAIVYNFTQPARVYAVSPRATSQLGGASVVIVGDFFVTNSSFAVFGGTSSPSCVVRNATSMVCVVPERNQHGVTSVAVTNNGFDFTSDDRVVFEYWPAEQVTSVAPAKHVAVATAHSVVALSTKNARDTDLLACFFGDRAVKAVYESGSRVRCAVPRGMAPGIYSVYLSNDGSVRSRSYAALELGAPPLVVSMEPSSGFTSGGHLVSIRGVRLDSVTHCRFGIIGDASPVVSADPDEIQCIAPASKTVGNVQVLLLARGAVMPVEDLRFTYQTTTGRTERELQVASPLSAAEASSAASSGAAPILRTVLPDSAPTRAGTWLTVDGEGFANSLSLTCRIGRSALATAQFQSPERVLCALPRLAPGTYEVQVSNNGAAFSSSPTKIEIYTDAYIESISPTSGPRTGGTAVTIRGRHFQRSANARCRFGHEQDGQIVKFVSSSEIVCVSPLQHDGSTTVPIVVMNNNASFTSNPVFFTYTTAADVVSVSPRSGSVRGGTEVLVKGYDLDMGDPDGLKCRFDGRIVPGELLVPGTLVRCRSPRVDVPGTVFVQLSTNGQDFMRSKVAFEFMPEIQIARLSPELGPALDASTVVSVFGSGFVNSVDLACFFDATRVPATWQSANEIRCATPRRTPSTVQVRVANNGVDKSLSMATYHFVRDIAVARISPKRGPIQGGTPVFVQGRNFVNHTLMACRFGEELAPATVLTPSLLTCVAPRQLKNLLASEGRVPVEVSVNRQDFTNSGLQFTYLQKCPVGMFCSMGTIMACPNGTVCDDHNGKCGGNFSLCSPGTFQPRESQKKCLPCPVGYFCPDHGMAKPVICPAGMVCDTHGLRTPEKPCPSGHYCRQGTKTADTSDFMTNPEYRVDSETQLVSFLDKARAWAYIPRAYPATRSRRIEHPPNETSCDLRVCDETDPSVLLAERPYACPVGRYCRRGVATQQAVAKNFSTPQKCFAGFFCPRGSSTPEGQGPCPTGHYCPNDVDAIVCPAGEYCPGVGNIKPRDCVPGTYNSIVKQSNCTLCPSGHVCPQWAMQAPVKCPAGFVCVSTGLSAPALLCPPGFICAEGTRTLDPEDVDPLRPKPCPKGTYCLGGVAHNRTSEWLPNQPEGAVAPQTCTEGTYCFEGTKTVSGSGMCLAGHYCPPGTTFPIVAPVGSFFGSSGGVAATLCFPGTYTPLKSTVKCDVCPAGHTCPGYGTYIPSICPKGFYRSLADSITCRACPEGTWSPHSGLPDVSFCEICPPGRVCGSSAMSSLSSSLPCAAGFVCGAGTNRRAQFDHLCPAGHYCAAATTMDHQFENVCERGNYCVRGTKDTERNKNKCPEGKFCPLGTANMTSIYVQCPSQTWSTGGQDELLDCAIRPVPVCDKRPTRQYYSQFTYDFQGTGVKFDSTVERTRTGEVEVSSVVYPVNESASVAFWKNDTVDAIRACPAKVGIAGGVLVTVIGRNFLDTNRTVCSFQLQSGGHSITSPAFYVSATRVTCRAPPYTGSDGNASAFTTLVDVRVSNYGVEYSETAATIQYASDASTDKTKTELEKCLVSVALEEGVRADDKAWFVLRGLSKATLSFDFRHVPQDLVYDEHFKIALFVKNSTCENPSCDVRGVVRPRGSESETTPCKRPLELPRWFLSDDVDKHDLLNLTVYALEDVLLKVEVHITYGLYTSVAPFFVNSTVVQIKAPVRANVTQGRDADTRPLSHSVSYDEALVVRDYSFLVAYFGGDGDYTSWPLNLPPKYADFERGRVLLSHNVSAESAQIPLITDPIEEIKPTAAYWLMPYGSASLTHQMVEKYRETFHELALDPTDETGTQYTFKFEKVLLSYLPFFSNCMGYDSFVPIFDLFESDQCALPEMTNELGGYGRSWWRRAYPSLPNQDDIRHVGPLDIAQEPIADLCNLDVQCHYEEDLPTADVTPRWFEQSQDTVLYYILREPATLANYFRGGEYYDTLNDEFGSDYFIPVTVDNSDVKNFEGDCSSLCFPRKVTLDVAYYQLDDRSKRIIKAQLIYSEFDRDATNAAYTLSLNLHALNYYGLIIQFAFEKQVFVFLFIALGSFLAVGAFVFWLVVRLTTFLESPPKLRFWSVFALIAPPPSVGVVTGCAPIFAVVGSFYVLLQGDRYFSMRSASGYWLMDNVVKHYIVDKINPDEVGATRNGRMGFCFLALGLYLMYVGVHIFVPKSISIAEKIMHEKNDQEAIERNVWWPTQWKRANMIFTSIKLGLFLVLVLEISFWSSFGNYMFYVIVLTEVMNARVEGWIEGQLGEALLMAPLVSALSLIGGLMTFGATDFGDFVMGNTLDFGMMLLMRVYLDTALEATGEFIGGIFSYFFDKLKAFGKGALAVFRSLTRSTATSGDATAGEKKEGEEAKKKEGEEENKEGEDAETVEPIIDFYMGCSMDRLALFYQPVLILLMMFFREEVQLPILYNIREKDMEIYLWYSLIILAFQLVCEVFVLNVVELFQGWKLYDYLVYCRYRFMQREQRWKGMEPNLDECIDENLRTLDQMCFSSQFFMMCTVHITGIVCFVVAIEMMARASYNMFGDPAMPVLAAFVLCVAIFVHRFVFWLAVKVEFWKIKHENTAWLAPPDDDDDFGMPRWEDLEKIKGASHEAYLMNQRITSETFRFKFLNYNRSWIVNQLPSVLTPRTLRRARPYLLAQFAKILDSLNPAISDDDEDDEDGRPRFGPVTLSAPSRTIIRMWLARARRVQRLKSAVQPLIQQARKSECEMCLSRRQLQVELAIPIEVLGDKFEAQSLAEEFDVAGWKEFFAAHEKFKTICLNCIIHLRDQQAKGGRGLFGFRGGDDGYGGPGGDWGEPQLSAASYALMQKWYRRAQDRVFGKHGKRRNMVDVSDDEEEALARHFEWTKKPVNLNAASTALARKWLLGARQSLGESGRLRTRIPDNLTAVPMSVRAGTATPVPKPPMKMGAAGGDASKTSKMRRK